MQTPWFVSVLFIQETSWILWTQKSPNKILLLKSVYGCSLAYAGIIKALEVLLYTGIIKALEVLLYAGIIKALKCYFLQVFF